MKKTQLKQIIKEEINKIFNEIIVNQPNSLKVKWLKNDLEKYYEKGLSSGFEMKDGKKVKEILGYYEDEEGNEEIDIIGYIFSPGKDIESYSEEEYDVFMDSLKPNEVDVNDPNNPNYGPNSFDVNQDWNNLTILGIKNDHQGTWVTFADPEDPYLDEEDYSFAIMKKQIDQVATGKRIGVEDGSGVSHYMTSKDAKNILSKI